MSNNKNTVGQIHHTTLDFRTCSDQHILKSLFLMSDLNVQILYLESIYCQYFEIVLKDASCGIYVATLNCFMSVKTYFT